MEPFIGEVRLLPYSFAPRNWALCNGQLLPISSNTALFSIIGTIYGGDGRTTFALPDLQGCAVPGVGQGPGLRNWAPGMRAGDDSVTLQESEMAAHSHGLGGLDVTGSTGTPSGNAYLGQDRRGGQGNIDYLAPSDTTLDAALAPQALSASGSGQPHENRQPFLSLNFCIALSGVFPPRS
ncbi:MAG: tail fiber protein [Cellvibrionaceae bacterium]